MSESVHIRRIARGLVVDVMLQFFLPIIGVIRNRWDKQYVLDLENTRKGQIIEVFTYRKN